MTTTDFETQYQYIPNELKQRSQWLLYKLENRNGKTSKVPYNAHNGRMGKTNDSTTWTSFEHAVKVASSGGYSGIGFALAPDDGLVGIDVDHPAGSEIALEIIEKFQDTYCEESPSGNLRIFTKGKIPRSGKGDADKSIEVYNWQSPRFLTVTGKWINTTSLAIEPCEALDWLFGKYFTPRNPSAQKSPTVNSAPQPATQQPVSTESLSDADILRIVGKAKNSGRFNELFGGAGNKDESAGDLALAKLLAFYTQSSGGGGESQLDSLMRQSARKNLHSGKWDKPHKADGQTYGQMTLAKAIASLNSTYSPTAKATTAKATTAKATTAKATTAKATTAKATTAKATAKATTATTTIKPYFSDTDLGNGARFKHLHGDKARYCKAWEKWLIWNGRRWEVDSGAIALTLAVETTAHVQKEIDYWRDLAQKELDDVKKEAILTLVKTLEKHVRYSSFKGGLQNMLWIAGEKDLPVEPDVLDATNWLLNTGNGTVDLKTGQLMPHNQSDLITKLVDIPFDANAQAPRWEKFVSEVMGGDKEMVHYLQKAIGYTLTGDTREQCFFFLYGLGSNGKSLFTSILERLLGGSKEYCTRVPAESLMKKSGSNNDGPSPSKAALAGARLVTAAEIEDGCTLDEAFIKDVTGQDEIAARFLHRDLFTFKPRFKLWMYGNHKPTIKGTDNGIKRRPRLIPFNQVFEGERVDKDLEAKLVAELPGILAWAVRGCLLWQAEGLKTPAAVAQATQDYFDEMDVIGLFIEACCVVATDGKVSAKSIYDAYVQWALGGGEKPMNQRRFGQKLTERGLARVKRGTGWWWSGVGLNDTGDVGEVTHFSKSDPLVTHQNQMGHLPEPAPTLNNSPLSDPSDPLYEEFTREEKNDDVGLYGDDSKSRVYETKDSGENGSHGSLDAIFTSGNNILQGDPSKINGSPMGHYGSLDGSLDYLHNRLPRGLARDDRRFVTDRLKSFATNEIPSILNGYVSEYRRAYDSESDVNRRDGVGRRAANAWLRELSERRVNIECAD